MILYERNQIIWLIQDKTAKPKNTSTGNYLVLQYVDEFKTILLRHIILRDYFVKKT